VNRDFGTITSQQSKLKSLANLLMSLANLDERERAVVRECLRAAVDGPFFPDWEFSIIFGLTRDEVKQILLSWPKINEADESVVRAINNSFNNLLGYPTRNKQERWPRFISVSGIELARIFDKWRGRRPRASYKIRDHFDDAM
jgi:hypothetical protein